MSSPRSAAIVGAGIAGLTIAWELHLRGIEVTVLDSSGVAGGASRGNAGWISPSLAHPLNSPDMLRQAILSVARPGAAVKVPHPYRSRTLGFISKFILNSHWKRWRQAVEALEYLNVNALSTYERLAQQCGFELKDGSYLAAFRMKSDHDRFINQLRHGESSAQALETVELDAGEVMKQAFFSEQVAYVSEVSGEKFVDPRLVCEAIATKLRDAGVKIVGGARVSEVATGPGGVSIALGTKERQVYDTVVFANGAWLADWRQQLGIRVAIHGGRGYSFRVQSKSVFSKPVYFPAERFVCTPLDGDIRISGLMDIEAPEAAMRRSRIHSMVNGLKTLASEIQYDVLSEEWVGARPCTSDGLPIVGQTALQGVFVHGGHAMWGMTHGPVSAALLAEQIVSGVPNPVLAPYDPCR